MFGVGEHHRPDFAVSAPAVALAAGAARTERIRLTSAVTVLSSDDPVRVFQDFATLDLLSGGRAEIMAGRGSFIESFPLFGYDLDDYDELFAEKLELLLALRDGERVTWRAGTARRSTTSASTRARCRTRCRCGSPSAATPQSVVRAGVLGLPLALAIIGGAARALRAARRPLPRGGREAGHDPPRAVAINSHAYVAATRSRPRRVLPRLRRDDEPDRPRARLAADDRASSSRRCARPRGALVVGSPEEVAEKILVPARAVRPPALPGPDQRRRPAARPRHARDRAARHRGRAAGARRGRLGGRPISAV